MVPAVATAGDQWVFRAPAARPTDHPDPNRNAYTVPEAPKSPACGRHFCVHWVAEGIDAPDPVDTDGDGVPDYVERVQAVAEHVYSIENEKLGWRDPKSDGRKGGGRGKTDIYLDQIGGALFGYAAPDRGQATKAHRLPRHLHGYLVLDNDYDPREFPGTTPEHDLEVTIAHEYNHILQFGYDAYQDAWFAESSAVWMEDQVYNGIDDYLRYVRRWVKRYDTPLTANSIKEYGSAVWNKWLARRYGRSIVRRAWARAVHTKPGGFSVSAYNSAIEAAGGSDFSRDFAHFASDLPEWRNDAVFPEGDLYPDVSRQGTPADQRPKARAPAQPHDLPAAARPRWPRARGGRLGHRPPRQRRRACPGRADRQRAPWARRRRAGVQARRREDDRAAATAGSLQPHHRGSRQRRYQRLGLQRPPAGLGLLDRQRAV